MNTTEPDQRDDTRECKLGLSRVERSCPDFNDNSMVRTTPHSTVGKILFPLHCPSVNTECYHFGSSERLRVSEVGRR